jgi:hypothetical protein
MHLEEAIVGVGFARQQGLKLGLPRLLLECLQDRLGLGDDSVVLLGLGHLDQFHRIREIAFQLVDGADAGLQAGTLAHDRLRVVGIVPEGWVLGERVQFGQAEDGRRVVKDASSAVPTTA